MANLIAMVDAETIRVPARIAITLIANEGDRAEETVYLSPISARAKDLLLAAIKERRVQLFNRRGW